MKRKDLIKILTKNGWWLERNGLKNEPIPRHNEIDEMLVKAIIKRQGLK